MERSCAAAATLILMGCGSLYAQASISQQADIDPASGRNIRYQTQDAMYLANEQWLLYACELPGGQTDIGSDHNNDAYWYSRYNLGNLLFRSGMGIHMVHNPLFKKHSVEDKKPDGSQMFPTPKDFMQFKIRQFCARTGVPCRLDPGNMDNPKAFPPKGAFPIFLEFASGSPRFTQKPALNDFNTLRWAEASMDKTISPGSIGQALVKQVYWAEDFFASHRKSPNGEQLLGNPKEYGNGFRGAALTAEAITKMFTLKSTLALDPKTGKLGGVDPATYDPAKGLRYYPHALLPKLAGKAGMPPAPMSWQIVDKSSHLSDQASLLWGTSEFYYYSDPTTKDAFDVLFGDQADHKTKGALFPMGPHTLSKGLSVVVFKNMMAMHFDKQNGTFHSIAEPGKKNGNISTADAGLALVALANLHQRLHDAPAPLLGMVKTAMTAQARFLTNKMVASDGGFYNNFNIGKNADRGTRSLTSQSFGIRGLLAAYSITKDASFKQAAEKAHSFMNKELWSEDAGAYRSEIGATTSTFTPINIGATLGALRELALVAPAGDGRIQIVKRLDRFFAATHANHGIQLAEIDPTGEPIPPMSQIQVMEANLSKLMLTDPKRAKGMKMKMADIDGDGVPKPGMAGGAFGFAPVPAATVTRKTPKTPK